jgi:hypothetical protein
MKLLVGIFYEIRKQKYVVLKTPNGEWTKEIGDMKTLKETRTITTLRIPNDPRSY